MSGDERSTAASIATGATVGLIAGLAASFAMDLFQTLIEPSSDDEGEPATQRAADAISKVATGAPLPKDSKALGGQLVHYGVGAVLGAAYGVAAEFAPEVTLGGGTAFATGTWALLDEAAVPAVGLGGPPGKSPPKTHVYGLASHLVFGLAAEMTRRAARHAVAGRSAVRLRPVPPCELQPSADAKGKLVPSSTQTLNLADARRIIAAGETQAEKIGVPYNLAVVDAGGNLIAHVRMDGAWLGSIDIAVHKAWTARAFDMSTEALGKMAQSGKPLFGIDSTNHDKVVIFGGGAPIKSGDTVIGAVGASGGTVDQDIDVVEAAAAVFA